MRKILLRAAAGAAMALSVAACGTTPATMMAEEPTLEPRFDAEMKLRRLPPPVQPVVVSVYDFPDLTGKHEPNTDFAEYSRAVTQGGAAIVIDALRAVANGSFYKVVEREALQDLLQERQIIRQMREAYDGPNAPPVRPLTLAGLLIDGGIVGYDSNTVTGGLGARFLGIGASTEYRKDTVTVYMRMVSVQTGEVLRSVSASKTIYSIGLSGGTFKFINFNELLEVEAGISTNEPSHYAVKQAIAKAVEALTMEGALADYWRFSDQAQGQQLVERYLKERDMAVAYDVTNAMVEPAAKTAKPPQPAL